MFFCCIVSLPNLWQFDLELVIHVILLNFYSFVYFDQLVVDFHSILLCSIVHKGASQMVLVIMILSTIARELRDAGSNPGLEGSPGGGAWQLTPVFLPGESCGQMEATVKAQSIMPHGVRHD